MPRCAPSVESHPVHVYALVEGTGWWRSEEHEEHYVECAQHLIESRDTLLKKSSKSNHATLLISDLMADQSLAWYANRGARKAGVSRYAREGAVKNRG